MPRQELNDLRMFYIIQYICHLDSTWNGYAIQHRGVSGLQLLTSGQAPCTALSTEEDNDPREVEAMTVAFKVHMYMLKK